ncbi:hypothetical protein ACSBR1_024771 [Camellia fascicularis]
MSRFWFDPTYVLVGLMFIQQHFKPRPTDILLISSPKCGITWLKAIAFAIMKRTSYNNIFPFKCEYLMAMNCNQLNSHLILSCGECGVIVVSMSGDSFSWLSSKGYFGSNTTDGKIKFHLMRYENEIPLKMEEQTILVIELNLDTCKAFDMFCKRISSYGPFWDHVLEYWKTCLVCPERVLFLNYEDVKRDTFIHVKKLVEFLGQPFSLEEESEGIEQGIVELCSFENLSNLEVNKNRTLRNGIKGDVFFRKGQVGDWKNHLTAQMIECLDQITKEKLGGLFF